MRIESQRFRRKNERESEYGDVEKDGGENSYAGQQHGGGGGGYLCTAP